MIDLGVRKPGSLIEIVFNSYAGATGASITITGLAVTDIEVYKDGANTSRADDGGYALLDTDGIDIGGVTGVQGFTIDLANNAVAGFYSAGSRYFVSVSAITIDAQTVNFSFMFRIGYPDAILNTTIATLASQTSFTLTEGPAEDDALNGCRVLIHDVASKVQLGFAHVLDYTGSTRTVTLVAGTTFTAATTDNVSIFPPADVGKIQGVQGGATNLQAATAAYSAQRGLAGTALPAAAADAAGGLPISDAGGLDLDARLDAAITSRATVAGIFSRAFEATKMSGLTFEEIVALCMCALAAKASGLETTTATFRNVGDTANAIVATVDADGNRTAVTLTLTSVR